MKNGWKVWTWFNAITLTIGMFYVLFSQNGDFLTRAIAGSWCAWALWAAVHIQGCPERRKIEVEDVTGIVTVKGR